MKFREIIAIILTLVTFSLPISCHADHMVTLTSFWVFSPIDTVLPLYPLVPDYEVSPNRTIIHLYVTAAQQSQNLVYGAFDIGVDGWQYGEYDSLNLLYWVWVNDSGYQTWGYTGFAVLNMPRNLLDGAYGYQLLYVNFTTPTDMINASLSLAYYFWTSSALVYGANISIAIYDWSTDTLTVVASGIFRSALGDSPFPTSTDWATTTIDLTDYLEPSKTYALVVFAIWYRNPWSYNATFFIDDVQLLVYRNITVYSGDVALANYSYDGTLQVSLILDDYACRSSSGLIYLVTGLERSAPINISDCVLVSESTSSITVSSYPLQKTVYIELVYEGTSGGYLNTSMSLVIVSNGHVVVERVYINATSR